MSDLIERAIESAKARIYRLQENKGGSEIHQKKVENQIELQKETVEALKFYKKYHPLEEQGLLLRLPYPVGTPIFFAFRSQGVVQGSIRSWRYGKNGLVFCSRGNSLVPEAIGKSVFLTREEAEKALAEMKGE